MSSSVKPYKIEIPEATLARISGRVAAVHWPKTSKGAGWKYGLDADWFRGLVGYWQRGYDWRKAEAGLNQTPQFTAEIDGRLVHFAHLKPDRQARPYPIMIMHGWPATFATMLPLARVLAAKGYEVIVPSLPGYGFSPPPDDEVRGLRFIAARMQKLMTAALGFERYFVHAGDHGAVVGDWLALDFPESVAGYHANLIAFRHAGAEFGSGRTGVDDATAEEEAFVKAEVERVEKESAYFKLQFTRPETIAYALEDSPVGWAAYMLDKWQKWTDAKPDAFEKVYGRDHLLTEAMIFLVTGTVATSLWPYAGFATEPFGLQKGRSRTDMRLWRDYDKGGHFPMLEVPEQLAADIDALCEKIVR
jgi:pimeloyl-ACP methyl ester carboxylesterase